MGCNRGLRLQRAEPEASIKSCQAEHSTPWRESMTCNGYEERKHLLMPPGRGSLVKLCQELFEQNTLYVWRKAMAFRNGHMERIAICRCPLSGTIIFLVPFFYSDDNEYVLTFRKTTTTTQQRTQREIYNVCIQYRSRCLDSASNVPELLTCLRIKHRTQFCCLRSTNMHSQARSDTTAHQSSGRAG
jgi:hypothetical protein